MVGFNGEVYLRPVKERCNIMKKIISIIAEKMSAAFVAAGYEETYAFVTVSNRPDLCQYQCNGAMAAAKQYKKAPKGFSSSGTVSTMRGVYVPFWLVDAECCFDYEEKYKQGFSYGSYDERAKWC